MEKTITGPAGTLIEPPSVEEEGYSFSGWLPVAPLVMPQNMDIYGTLTILSYTVKILDSETIYSEVGIWPVTSPEVEFQSAIASVGHLPSVAVPAGCHIYSYTHRKQLHTYLLP